MNLEKRKTLFGKKSKKGFAMILELIFIIIIFVVLAIVAIVGYQVYDELTDDLEADPDIAQVAKDNNSGLFTRYASLFDNLFMFTFVFLTLFLLIGAYMADERPIFLVIGLIIFIFILIVSMLLANTFDDVASDSTLALSANQFVFMGWILSHLLEVLIGVGFLMAIVLYMKFRG